MDIARREGFTGKLAIHTHIPGTPFHEVGLHAGVRVEAARTCCSSSPNASAVTVSGTARFPESRSTSCLWAFVHTAAT